MSTRRRCTARHPGTAKRCEMREHFNEATDHRVWRHEKVELRWPSVLKRARSPELAEAMAPGAFFAEALVAARSRLPHPDIHPARWGPINPLDLPPASPAALVDGEDDSECEVVERPPVRPSTRPRRPGRVALVAALLTLVSFGPPEPG